MSDDITAVRDVVEQNRKNIEAIAKELDVDRHLGEDAGGAKWAGLFGLPSGGSAEKSAEAETAALMTQNAENLAALAEAVGVSKHRVEGSSTKASWSKTLGLSHEE